MYCRKRRFSRRDGITTSLRVRTHPTTAAIGAWPRFRDSWPLATIRLFVKNVCSDATTAYSSVLMSAESPCAISMSLELFSVHAVRSVTASMTSRALG